MLSSLSRRSWITLHDGEDHDPTTHPQHYPHHIPSQWLFDHDFKFYWMMYYICLCLLSAVIIHSIEDTIPPIDAYFHTVSAMTGAGLATIPMYHFSKTSFVVMGLLMYFGSSSFMLLPTLVYRRYCFGRINHHMDHLRSLRQLPHVKQLTYPEQSVVQEYQVLDDALGVLVYVVLLYNTLVLSLGILLLQAALRLKPLPLELQQRNFSYLDHTVYLTVSAFANAGCTLTSDNLMSTADNPCAYLLLTCLILAGNTALPICLRVLIAIIIRMEPYLSFLPRYWKSTSLSQQRNSSNSTNPLHPDVQSNHSKLRHILQYILNNPRRLTTHLFSNLQTKVLAFMVLFLIILQYIFFLGSTMNRDSARIDHSKAALAGIGYFQTLSVRSAGFTIMDLRLLNQGLLVVYCLMMYISSFPFVSVLDSSVHKHSTTATSHHQVSSTTNNPLQPSDQGQLIDELQPQSNQQSVQQAKGQKQESQQPEAEGAEELNDDPEVSTDSSSTTDYGDDDHINVVAINKKFITTYFYRHSFFILLAILILAFSEDKMLYDPTMNVNLWYIFFEVISAYGNVGLSLGIEGELYSLSGAMTNTGKCVIIFVMLLGKHRGLPNKHDDVIDFQFHRYRTACHYHPHHHHHQDNVEQHQALIMLNEESQEEESSMENKLPLPSSKRSTKQSSRDNTAKPIPSKACNIKSSKISWFSTRSRFNSSRRIATQQSLQQRKAISDKTEYNPLVVKSMK